MEEEIYYQGVCWADELSPLEDRILSNEFKSDTKVRCHKFDEFFKEGLSFMFCVELMGVCNRHLRHLDVADYESSCFDFGEDFSKVFVGIWLDHGKCSI